MKWILSNQLRTMRSNATRMRTAKESLWVVVTQVSVVIASVALVRVITEHLGPEEYGKLGLGLTLSGLVIQVIMGGITNGIGRFYSVASKEEDLASFLLDSAILFGKSALIVVVLGIAIMFGLIALGEVQWIGISIVALILAVSMGGSTIMNTLQNAARNRGVVALSQTLNAWLKIGLAVLAIRLLGATSVVALLGYLASLLVVLVVQILLAKRFLLPDGSAFQTKRKWRTDIWAYSWPFSVWGVFTWLQISSDRWALQFFTDAGTVGRYLALFQISYAPIGLIINALMTFLGPILYQISGDATQVEANMSVHRIVWRVSAGSLFVTVIAVFVAKQMHGWLFRYLVAEEYRGVSHLMPLMVLAGGLFAAGQVLALKLMSDFRSRSLLYAKIGTAIIGTILNIVMAFFFGLNGIVLSLLGFSSIYFLWTAFLAARPQHS